MCLYRAICLLHKIRNQKVPTKTIAKNYIQWISSVFPYSNSCCIIKCKLDYFLVISKNDGVVLASNTLLNFREFIAIIRFVKYLSI